MAGGSAHSQLVVRPSLNLYGGGGASARSSFINQWAADPTAGGGEGGGASGDVWLGPDAARGGGEGGGASGDLHTTTDATAGGGEGGGSAGDVYTPGTVTPGTSCATAGTVAVGTTYGATVTFPGNQWWVLPAYTAGLVYRVVTTGIGGMMGASIALYKGGCSGLVNIIPDHSITNCRDFVAPDNGPLHLMFAAPIGPGVAYTFKIEQALC
ncbi:MAG: hypothetical protein LLG14_23035 [Nocardiaceae bacterium]|nr:hypothetical protein [Nocardiaceae bacterium]